jgi:hypothetical protein
MTNDELDEVQRLKAQVDQMRGELDDALAALWSAHKRGYLYKMERFPASASASMRSGGSTPMSTW